MLSGNNAFSMELIFIKFYNEIFAIGLFFVIVVVMILFMYIYNNGTPNPPEHVYEPVETGDNARDAPVEDDPAANVEMWREYTRELNAQAAGASEVPPTNNVQIDLYDPFEGYWEGDEWRGGTRGDGDGRGSVASSASSSSSGSIEDELCALRTHQEMLQMRRDNLQLDMGYSEAHARVLNCGMLEVAFVYDVSAKNMTVHLLQATNIMMQDKTKPTAIQVHCVLLPDKRKRYKSKMKSEQNPQFLENFLFPKIPPEEVYSKSVRFRLYNCERMKRNRLIAEAIVNFSSSNLQTHENIWIPLEPVGNKIVSKLATEALSLSQFAGQASSATEAERNTQCGLKLGFAYSSVSGRLTLEIIKGRHFKKATASKSPDSFVKLMLLSGLGQVMCVDKTDVRRGLPHPLFKDTFFHQIPLFQLPDITLMIIVYDKKSRKRKERIGWISFGQDSSSEEQQAHWNQMSEAKGVLISQWHTLVQT